METKKLSSGSSSVADLVDGQVVRKPTSDTDIGEWLKAAEKECLITKRLQQTKCVVPQAVLNNNALISPFFEGKPLCEQTYINLSSTAQKEISSAFADFLYKLHHLQKKSSEDDYYVSDRFTKKLKDINLPSDLEDILHSAINAIVNDKRVQTQTGLCHNDLIKDNILYNEQQNKLAIIDFGDADFGSVYRDFGSLCRSKQLGINFTRDVVTSYNEICKKENQPEIDFTLVKQATILSSFEKLRYYRGSELENRFNQLRKLHQKLFQNEAVTADLFAFVSKYNKRE